jgi:hypothetical protein
MYVRAVDKGDKAEARAILEEIEGTEAVTPAQISALPSIEEAIKQRLEKAGYSVDTNLGNKNSPISLAVYDEESDRYLIGIVLDKDAFAASDACLERDVCQPRFLTSKGWNLIRVWSRDWWLYPTKVIKAITAAAEKAKKAKK